MSFQDLISEITLHSAAALKSLEIPAATPKHAGKKRFRSSKLADGKMCADLKDRSVVLQGGEGPVRFPLYEDSQVFGFTASSLPEAKPADLDQDCDTDEEQMLEAQRQCIFD